ncbi:hypothetical protein VTH06DRAFT_726 [Thermothelomyces fergusii]
MALDLSGKWRAKTHDFTLVCRALGSATKIRTDYTTRSSLHDPIRNNSHAAYAPFHAGKNISSSNPGPANELAEKKKAHGEKRS